MKKYDISKIPQKDRIYNIYEKSDILLKWREAAMFNRNESGKNLATTEQYPLKMKILVLDLDGTLTNDAKEITPRTMEALMEAQRRGVVVVLASGRPTYGIVPLAEQLRLSDYGGYILSYNGGEVIDCKHEKILFAQTMTDAALDAAFRMARERGHAVLSYRDAEILTTDADDCYVLEESRINRMAVRGWGSACWTNFRLIRSSCWRRVILRTWQLPSVNCSGFWLPMGCGYIVLRPSSWRWCLRALTRRRV